MCFKSNYNLFSICHIPDKWGKSTSRNRLHFQPTHICCFMTISNCCQTWNSRNSEIRSFTRSQIYILNVKRNLFRAHLFFRHIQCMIVVAKIYYRIKMIFQYILILLLDIILSQAMRRNIMLSNSILFSTIYCDFKRLFEYFNCQCNETTLGVSGDIFTMWCHMLNFNQMSLFLFQLQINLNLYIFY